MPRRKATTERLAAFSDGVFSVIITIMVLDLKAPEQPTFRALLPLWPTALSYLVSYTFVAIVWLNHHHLLRFTEYPTPRLMWINFCAFICGVPGALHNGMGCRYASGSSSRLYIRGCVCSGGIGLPSVRAPCPGSRGCSRDFAPDSSTRKSAFVRCLWTFSDGNVCIASLSLVGFRFGVLRSAPLSTAGTSWNAGRRRQR